MGRTRQPAPVELEIEVTGTTRSTGPIPAVADDPEATHPTLAERMAHGGGLVLEGIEHARDLHARKGPRPGAVPAASGSSARAGHGTDIVRPVLVDPSVACEMALSGELFDAPIPHLAVEQPGDRRTLTWRATVSCGRRRRRHATLHLMASPSLLVTVIELVPARRVRSGRRRFVVDGIDAIEELAGRLAAAGQRNGSGSSSAWTTDNRCVDRVNAT